MKKLLDVKNIIILVLTASTAIVAINPKGIMPNRTEYTLKIDSVPYAVYDTLLIHDTIPVDVPFEVEVEVEKLVEVPVYQKIDTAEILKIYTAKTEYKDLIQLPNNQGNIAVIDVISQNKVVSRKLETKITPKTVRDTVFTPQPLKTIYYLGFESKFDKANYVKLLGIGLMVKDKKERLYRVSAGLDNRVADDGLNGKLTPFIGGGVYWKIGQKK
jgi:hypothetical protein